MGIRRQPRLWKNSSAGCPPTGSAPPEKPCFVTASLVSGEGEASVLLHAGEQMAVSVEGFILTGFTGLLSRLTWQESISIVHNSPLPSVVTVIWEPGVSFRGALAAMYTKEALPADPHMNSGVRYEFVEGDALPLSESGLDLQLTAQKEPQLLRLVLTSSTSRWAEETPQGWLSLLHRLLQAAATAPETPLSLLPVQEEAGTPNFYKKLNDTASEYATNLCAPDLIARQAELYPDTVAVVFGRRLDWQERARYLSAQSRHRWEDIVEALGVSLRGAFRWIDRKLAFALPEYIRRRVARLGVDGLRPTVQQSYPGKIVLFRASEVVQISGTEPSLGWNSVAKDGVLVEFAPGDHESMFRDPHLPRFGAILQRVLREGEDSCGFAGVQATTEASV